MDVHTPEAKIFGVTCGKVHASSFMNCEEEVRFCPLTLFLVVGHPKSRTTQHSLPGAVIFSFMTAPFLCPFLLGSRSSRDYSAHTKARHSHMLYQF